MTPSSRGSVCLFLHIPKTAGTTLKHSIYENYSEPGYNGNWFHDGIYYFPYGFHKAVRPELTRNVRRMLAREDLRAVTGHFWYGVHDAIPRPCFYITLLRDPVDRIFSLYYHILRKADELYHDKIISRGATVEEFVAEFSCREVDNDQTRRIAGVEPRFGRCTVRTLEQAKRNLRERFAFVGTTDRFDESMIALKRLLGWTWVFYLPGLVNESRPRRDALPGGTVDLIRKYNEYDLELYHYSVALLDERIAALGNSFAPEVERFREANRAYIKEAPAAQTSA
jgi:Sulfotransferase family